MMGKNRIRILLAAMAISFLAGALWLVATDAAENQAYSDLAARVRAPETSAGDAGIDWSLLREGCPGTVAWLSVSGTGIDYPVTQTSGDEPLSFYLEHDAWGRPSLAGNPYLDRRSSADGRHMLVFGHRVGLSDKMFSAVAGTVDKAGLDALGDASWSTPAGGTATFRPVFSLRVDELYEPVQTFAWADADALRAWLKALEADAAAVRDDADDLISRADRVLTLSTCSSAWPGERGRVLSVFVSAP